MCLSSIERDDHHLFGFKQCIVEMTAASKRFSSLENRKTIFWPPWQVDRKKLCRNFLSMDKTNEVDSLNRSFLDQKPCEYAFTGEQKQIDKTERHILQFSYQEQFWLVFHYFVNFVNYISKVHVQIVFNCIVFNCRIELLYNLSILSSILHDSYLFSCKIWVA